jgi:hypothetical protein
MYYEKKTFSIGNFDFESCVLWVKVIVKTAWDRDDVEFIFVAATVLKTLIFKDLNDLRPGFVPRVHEVEDIAV